MNALMPNKMNAPGMGGQTSGEAAEALKYYPVWQQQFGDGVTELQFREWLQQMQGGQSQSMPQSRMMNAFSYG